MDEHDGLMALVAGLEDDDENQCDPPAHDRQPLEFKAPAHPVGALDNAGTTSTYGLAPRARSPRRRPSQPGAIPISRSSLTAQQAAAASQERSHRITAFQRPATQQRPGAPGQRAFKDVGQGSLIERHSGLKVKNPLVSSSQMETRLSGISIVRLGQLRSRHQGPGLGAAWCTLAVLGECSPPRVSASGNAYSIWKLADLDQACVSLFLFGRAHEELRREPPGRLVAVFNAKVRADGGEFSLSADSAEQLLLLGTASEFGYCKATKKNGDACRVPVNAARCPYCPHHVGAEFARIQPKRIELQGGQLKSAFRPAMSSSFRWQPGQFQSADAAARPRMAAISKEQLHSTAAKAAGKGSTSGASYVRTVADPGAARAAAAETELARLRRNKMSKDAAPIPLARTVNVVITSGGLQGGGAAGAGGKRKAGGAGNALPAHKRASPGGAGSSADGAGMVLLEEDDIFLQLTPLAFSAEQAAARQRAAALIAAAGGPSRLSTSTAVPAFLAAPLQHMQQQAAAMAGAGASQQASSSRQVQPLAAGQSRPAAAVSAAQQRSVAAKLGVALVPRPTQQQQQQQQARQAAAAKPVSGFAAAFGSVILEMQARQGEEGDAASGSLYRDVVEDEEAARLDKVLGVLEQKDEMAAKMDATRTLEVSAWRCSVCACTAEYRRPQCAQAHPQALSKVQVTKRWWECGSCRHRFATVGVRHPRCRCPKCDLPGVEFNAVSMLRPQREAAHVAAQSSVAGRDKLLARGIEQKWVG